MTFYVTTPGKQLSVSVEPFVDLSGQRGTNALDRLKIGAPGLGDRLRVPEMVQQGLFPARANARHLIQNGFPNGFTALFAVGTDCEPMGLISDTLEEVRYGIPRLQSDGIGAVRPENTLVPGIAVRAFGDAFSLDGSGGGDREAALSSLAAAASTAAAAALSAKGGESTINETDFESLVFIPSNSQPGWLRNGWLSPRWTSEPHPPQLWGGGGGSLPVMMGKGHPIRMPNQGVSFAQRHVNSWLPPLPPTPSLIFGGSDDR